MKKGLFILEVTFDEFSFPYVKEDVKTCSIEEWASQWGYEFSIEENSIIFKGELVPGYEVDSYGNISIILTDKFNGRKDNWDLMVSFEEITIKMV